MHEQLKEVLTEVYNEKLKSLYEMYLDNAIGSNDGTDLPELQRFHIGAKKLEVAHLFALKQMKL